MNKFFSLSFVDFIKRFRIRAGIKTRGRIKQNALKRLSKNKTSYQFVLDCGWVRVSKQLIIYGFISSIFFLTACGGETNNKNSELFVAETVESETEEAVAEENGTEESRADNPEEPLDAEAIEESVSDTNNNSESGNTDIVSNADIISEDETETIDNVTDESSADSGNEDDGSITTIVIVNKNTSNTINVPITFGHVFAEGEVQPGQTITGRSDSNDIVALQIDKKATHSDGSLRHAIISAVIPSMSGASAFSLELIKSPSVASQSTVNLDDLLATNFDAQIEITINNTVYTASAKDFLQNNSQDVWLQGDIVGEWITSGGLVSSEGAVHPHLHARFYVRAYSGNLNTRISVVIENNWAYEENPSNITYDLNVSIAGESVLQETQLTHYHHARWRRVFWAGDKPNVYAQHNVNYLINSAAVPNYDQSITLSDEALAGMATNWDGEAKKLMGIGTVEAYMPGGGARPDIGPLPRWAARYLISGHENAYATTLGNGEQAGSWSIHYRDKDTGAPITLDDYPYMTTLGNYTDTFNPNTEAYEGFPACSDCSSPYFADSSHQPSLSYVPYLLTGDYFHLEELQFWSNWNLIRPNNYYRGYADGLIWKFQVRGQAWTLRTLAQAAYITPDSDTLKSYFTEKLSNNLDYFNEEYTNNPEANKLGWVHWLAYEYVLSPWMDDFFTWSVGHIVELGFSDWQNFVDWKSAFPVNRMTDPDFCYVYASAYHVNARDNANSEYYSTFTELKEAYETEENLDGSLACGSQPMADQFNLDAGSMLGYPYSATGYPANLQPALAVAVGSSAPNAQAAWDLFNGLSVTPDYTRDPQFAVIPRNTPRNQNSSETPENNSGDGSGETLEDDSEGNADDSQENNADDSSENNADDSSNENADDSSENNTDGSSNENADGSSEDGNDASNGGSGTEDIGHGSPPLISGNTWVQTNPEVFLPEDLNGAAYKPRSKGYNNSVYRSETGEIIFYDGVEDLDRYPGFYSNAITKWNIGLNRIDIVKADNWGGGSYGGGELLPAFSNDETPSPRHTYDGFAYIPGSDQIFMHLGANWRVGSEATSEAIDQLEQDDLSTWIFNFSNKKWTRIDNNIRSMWPSVYTVSSYESHIRFWPEENKIIFIGAGAQKVAEFDLSNQTWQEVTLANTSPQTVYAALSTWDSQRQRWVFRKDEKVWFYDPASKSFSSLPDCGIVGKDITYISKHDVYLVNGITAAETRIFDPATQAWQTIGGGDLSFSGAPFQYIEYDSVNDVVGMVTQGGDFYIFRYEP